LGWSRSCGDSSVAGARGWCRRRCRVVESRARDDVGSQLLVDVDEDARVGLGVQLGAEGAGGFGGSRAGDDQVDALRVVLGAIDGAR
jgi:hypothetical protein